MTSRAPHSPPPPPPLPFPARVPFIDSLGLELHHYAGGRAEVCVNLDAAHLNSWEVAHGGVVMTMLDVAMALAARSGHPNDNAVATIEMKTSFMRPAEGQLRATGVMQHMTPTMAFCSADLHDERGQLCASATGTFKYLRALPSRGKLKKPGAHPAADAPSRPPPPTENDPLP